MNGAAFGGGCEFALAADFIYAASSARFALTETQLGIIPGAGRTQALPRAAGTRRAAELIYSGLLFSADEAPDWGIVNRVIAPEHLLTEAVASAARIAANAPLAVRQAKKSIRIGTQMDLNRGLEVANRSLQAPRRHQRSSRRRAGLSTPRPASVWPSQCLRSLH